MDKLSETLKFIVAEIGKGSPLKAQLINFTGIEEKLQELFDCAFEAGQEDADNSRYRRAWIKSRPDVPSLEPPGSPPSHQNMDEMLSKLVEEGKITQQQADQLKAWEAAKPDPSADQQTFEEWLKSRPDVPFLGPPGSPPCHQNSDPSNLPHTTPQSTN
jgi:hypothetical protein